MSLQAAAAYQEGLLSPETLKCLGAILEVLEYRTVSYDRYEVLHYLILPYTVIVIEFPGIPMKRRTAKRPATLRFRPIFNNLH